MKQGQHINSGKRQLHERAKRIKTTGLPPSDRPAHSHIADVDYAHPDKNGVQDPLAQNISPRTVIARVAQTPSGHRREGGRLLAGGATRKPHQLTHGVRRRLSLGTFGLQQRREEDSPKYGDIQERFAPQCRHQRPGTVSPSLSTESSSTRANTARDILLIHSCRKKPFPTMVKQHQTPATAHIRAQRTHVVLLHEFGGASSSQGCRCGGRKRDASTNRENFRAPWRC